MKQWLSDFADSKFLKKIAQKGSYLDTLYKRTKGELPTVESTIEEFVTRTGLMFNQDYRERYNKRRENVKIAVRKLTFEQTKEYFERVVLRFLRNQSPVEYIENEISTKVLNESDLVPGEKEKLVKHINQFIKTNKEIEDRKGQEPLMVDNYDPWDVSGMILNERRYQGSKKPLSLRHAEEGGKDFLVEAPTVSGKSRGRYGTIDRRSWEGRPLLDYMDAVKRVQGRQNKNFCLDVNKKLDSLREEYPETIDPVLREMSYRGMVKDLRSAIQLNDAQPDFYTVRCMYPGCGMAFGATSPNGAYVNGQHLADHYIHMFTEKGQTKYTPVSYPYQPGEKIQKLDAERLEAHYDGRPVVESDSYGYMLSRYPREYELRYMLSHPMTITDDEGATKREWERMWVFPDEITSLKLNDKDLQEAIQRIAKFNPSGGGLNLSLDLVEDPEIMSSFLPQIKEELGIEPEETSYDVNIKDMLTALHQVLYEQWKEHIGKGYTPSLEEWRRITKQYKKRPQMSKIWQQPSKATAMFEDSIADKDPRWYNRMQYNKLKCERCGFTLGILTAEDQKDLTRLKQEQRDLVGIQNPSPKEKKELEEIQSQIAFYKKKEQPIIFKNAAERNSWVCPNCNKPIILHVPFKCPIDRKTITMITIADEELKYGKTAYPAECKDGDARGLVYVDRIPDPTKEKAPIEISTSLLEEAEKSIEKPEETVEESKKPLSQEERRSLEMRQMFTD